jgi:hypothetical protein
MPGTYGFYCTTLEYKQRTLLPNLVGAHVDVSDLLDDICDGCGGCERMSYGSPDGTTLWVSVLREEGHRTHYVVLDVDDNTFVLNAITCSLAGRDNASDSATVYAEVLEMVLDEWDEHIANRNERREQEDREGRRMAAFESRGQWG